MASPAMMENTIKTPAYHTSLVSRVRSRLAPSIVDLVFVFFAVAIPLAMAGRLLNSDGDPARHMSIGEQILEQGGLLHTYPFSFTRPGEPFLAFEWGSEVLFALAYRAGGLAAVAIFAGLVLGLTYALIALLLRRHGVDPLLAYLTAIGAAILGGTHWVARPHLFTFLGVAVMLHFLERPGRGRLWLFMPLFMLWANLHGGFVYGFIVIAAYIVGDFAERRLSSEPAIWDSRLRYHLGALGLAVVATVVNPYGLRLHAHVLGFLGGSNLIMRTTDEFLSPDFHMLYGKLFLVALLIVVTALALSRRRPSFPHLLLLLAGIGFALLAKRNIPLFALTALPVLTLDFDLDWRAMRFRGLNHLRTAFEDDRGRRVGASSAIVAALLVLLALNRGAVAGAQLVPARFDPEAFPVAAVERARSEGLRGRMFNNFIWGGYLLHAWPEQQVFIDGGTDFYGDSIVQDYLRVAGVRPGWREVLSRWEISLVLIPRRSALDRALSQEPGWCLWYGDPMAAVYRRTLVGSDSNVDCGELEAAIGREG